VKGAIDNSINLAISGLQEEFNEERKEISTRNLPTAYPRV
jgi:hypothetical protein